MATTNLTKLVAQNKAASATTFETAKDLDKTLWSIALVV